MISVTEIVKNMVRSVEEGEGQLSTTLKLQIGIENGR